MQQDKDGNTAFHLALEKKHDSVLELACQQRRVQYMLKVAKLSGTPHSSKPLITDK